MGDSVFQSLIGRLKTPLFAELTTAMLRFQSLIGRLKTFDTTFEPSNRVALRMFQSLIGRLKTPQRITDGAPAEHCFNPS